NEVRCVLVLPDVAEDSAHGCPPGRGQMRARREEKGSRETNHSDPSAPWVAFVGASPRRFAPPITTVPAEGPSAEWFDRSLPRHPPVGGPGACRTRLPSRSARASTHSFWGTG